MGEIDLTNIIIDDFRKGRHNPFNKYVYILTHIHTDHLKGLSNTWNFGNIYCSTITKKLILNKFKKLKDYLITLPLEQPTQITLAEGINVTITFFDANHCSGAVMVLLEGYFGRYFYTGDCRFNQNIFQKYNYLYPSEVINSNFQKCSLQIDKMWLDNTFCHPKWDFPPQTQALSQIDKFIQQNKQTRIIIGMDYYGKEEVLIFIAKKYDTLIVVDEYRYENLIAMEFDREYFTTNRNQGTIEVVNRAMMKERMEELKDCVGMVMSGWNNAPHWRDNTFFVPYSLHSNYKEIVKLVKSISPSLIDPIVALGSRDDSGDDSQMFSTTGHAKAFEDIKKKYCSPLTPEYRRNMEDTALMQELKKKFEIDRSAHEINQKMLGLSTVYVPNKGKGYKITSERNEEEIESLKKRVRQRRKHLQQKEIVIDDQNVNKANEEIIISQGEEEDLQIMSKSKYLLERSMNRRKQRKEEGSVDVNKLLKIRSYRNEEEVMLDFYQEIKDQIMSTLCIGK